MASTSAATEANPHLVLDAGLLLSTDASALDRAQYDNEATREALFKARALDSTRALIAHLRTQLPIAQHPDHGPLAALPAPVYPLLPREKPLPKPKAETKWESFAKRKGIASNTKKDKLVWDDETKEWVPRWGYKGKNKKEEEQWIHELPASAGDDYNPVAKLKKQRKERSLHNKAQQIKNVNRAAAPSGGGASAGSANSTKSKEDRPGGLGSGVANDAAARRRGQRTEQMDRLEAEARQSRGSTASMGRFDRRLEGEAKEKGIKRKVGAEARDCGGQCCVGLEFRTSVLITDQLFLMSSAV